MKIGFAKKSVMSRAAFQSLRDARRPIVWANLS
jgi:hypothetical protein